MNTNFLMSAEEQDKLRILARKLEKEGKIEEALEVYKKVPLTPFLAKAAKEVYGINYLLNSGINLSAAEEEYGKDWLHN